MRAIWYHDSGGGREKHWGTGRPAHPEWHYSDHGLCWSRRPYARQVRFDLRA